MFKSKKSITLIELLISLIIVGLIAGALAVFLSRGINIWSQTAKEADIIGQARESIDMMTREIKHTRKGTITIANADEFEFESDVDSDGESEKIKYDLNSSIIQRTEEDGSAYAIADNVNSLAFAYYNSSGTQLVPTAGTDDQSERDTIKYINITINMQQDISVASRVYLKNFKEY